MSMVRLSSPDFDRYPRLRDALAAAQSAELSPGDAIFIPTLWWHHVESLDREFNALVNYWWSGALGGVERTPSGMDCLLHGLLNVAPLSAELRRAWQSLFEHYIFGATDDRDAHIPENRRGVLGGADPESIRRARNVLIANLRRDLDGGI